MTKAFQFLCFAAGLAVLAWVGCGYVHRDAWALGMTALITAFYVVGALELRRCDRITAGLVTALRALRETPPSLEDWLERVPPPLRPALRRRLDGERVALPGPALAPALVGLLVLLGMMGTFVGMVATLQGTGLALQSATDVQAVRAALSAPVKGLGFAFGTSVAGVAASAMLGLMTALCRRERGLAVQWLDHQLATGLRRYSASHRQEEGLRLLQLQAETLPRLVERMESMMTSMERQTESLGARLVAGQEAFHRETGTAFTELAASVDRSLAQATRSAGASVEAATQAAMAQLTRQAEALHRTVAGAVEQQLNGLRSRAELAAATFSDDWRRALEQQRATWVESLERTAAREDELSVQHRQVLQSLTGLIAAVHQSSSDQRAAVDAAVAGSLASLDRAGDRLDSAVQAGDARLTDASAQVATGAVEVASLAEAFHVAIQLFAQSAQQLGTKMETIENALTRSLARSDEQLAYYVAQAREVVDLTLMSQKQVLEALHKVPSRQASTAQL
jgi:hypothetical protein